MSDDANLLLEVALDLANSLNNADRFDRLLSTIRKAIQCDAVTLLAKNKQVLTPLATQGLLNEALGRRFNIDQHPRLHALCSATKPHRFPADCALPDPFDGLLLGVEGDLPIHSCMGLPLYSDQQLIGLVTLDAFQPHVFERISERTLTLLAALSAATLKTALELNTLADSARHAQQVLAELTHEALLKDGGEIVGQSPVMQTLKSDIELVANSQFSVLILGETGTGKELVARTLHQLSARQHQPLVYLNCASLTETLAEAELFGHAKGAFTGAEKARLGKFQLADGGTIFLDEVGELPLSIQSKLLRVLQSGEVQPVGQDHVQYVDVRVIAATNRDLPQEIANGQFRADLYHRLSVYPLQVPSLAARGNDIVLLAGFFLEKAAVKLGFRQLKLSHAAADKLLNYPWPGNVRELEHVISRAALQAKRDHLPSDIVSLSPEMIQLSSALLINSVEKVSVYQQGFGTTKDIEDTENIDRTVSIERTTAAEPITDLKHATQQFQKRQIEAALRHAHFKWSDAARALGMDRSNLVRLSKRLGIVVKKSL